MKRFVLVFTLCLLQNWGPIHAQTTATGHWTATYADSVSSGSMKFDLSQDQNNMVSGSYKTSTGGEGRITGVIDGSTLRFSLTQTVEACPGHFTGDANLSREIWSGHYEGTDCLGDHRSGVLTLKRAEKGEAEAGEVKRLPTGEILPSGVIFVKGLPVWVTKTDDYLLLSGGLIENGYFSMAIVVMNLSKKAVTFFPEEITIQEVLNHKQLRQFTPKDIAKSIRSKAAWRGALVAFLVGMGSAAPRTSYGSGTFTARDNSGNFIYGSVNTTTNTFTSPNGNAVRAATDPIYRSADEKIDKITKKAAYSQTLFEKDFTGGFVYFNKPQKTDVRKYFKVNAKNYWVSAIVPLGEEKFQFWFPIELLRAGAVTATP